MHTPHEFDYDLWTTVENGITHYWVRVKSTGEISGVEHDVMKYLRAEEKALRRSYSKPEPSDKNGIISENRRYHEELSLDTVPDHDEEYPDWLADPHDRIADTITNWIEEDFLKLLTPFQLEVYNSCLKGDMSVRDFAKKKKRHYSSVNEAVDAIRNKFTKNS